ncbi:Hypothetical predicted protein [Octopus vulgaris]|uniref:Uncharacterized protein n=1 Tax=Octopus vulgaris TaxID=6645 RepID=A0AA36EXP2_OCTVU|nr:Hypothetical predicted protein [Octopus vulgaris]
MFTILVPQGNIASAMNILITSGFNPCSQTCCDLNLDYKIIVINPFSQSGLKPFLIISENMKNNKTYRHFSMFNS